MKLTSEYQEIVKSVLAYLRTEEHARQVIRLARKLQGDGW